MYRIPRNARNYWFLVSSSMSSKFEIDGAWTFHNDGLGRTVLAFCRCRVDLDL